jgi:serine/threonine protein kinase
MSWSDPLQGNPRYESIRTLSRGTRSFVQLALDRSTSEQVAIKFTQRGGLSLVAMAVMRRKAGVLGPSTLLQLKNSVTILMGVLGWVLYMLFPVHFTHT